jgi:hypothetical protein
VVVAAIGDVDGDGRGDVLVASPGTIDHSRSRAGQVSLYSGGKGTELKRWGGSQRGELYGRMVVSAGDVDGDGFEDIAVGAPWYRHGEAERIGRLQIRSGRKMNVLAELAGDEADCWFGWHVRRAPDPEGRGRPALLVASLRHPGGGRPGVGVIDLLVLRRAPAPDAQGTTTRDARRSDIR